jgi:hypothetical protein
VATLTLVGLLAAELNHEAAGLQNIGHRNGPEVVASSDLYFALNDMDAQVANALLVGEIQSLGFTRTQALAVYEQRRQQVDRDMQLAAVTTEDPATQASVRQVIDDLGRYEALAAQTVLVDQQNPHLAGRPSTAALAQYRQTTDLLKTHLLPSARRLSDLNARALESTYQSEHDRVLSTRILVVLLGAIALISLIGLQIYLARRFHRLVNPALVAATIVTATSLVLAVGLLSHQSEHLRTAKKDAFDSLLVLTQARAVSYDANADESRWLLDPQRSGQYQDAFLAKSQLLVALTGATLSTYDQSLTTAIHAYQRDPEDLKWQGLFGVEFRNITFIGERAAAESTLLSYQTYQLDDRHIRSLADSGNLAGAIAFCTSYAPGASNYAFGQYDDSLAKLIAINQSAFDTAIRDGNREMTGWTIGVWVAGALLLGLLAMGVRPRLAEYRTPK